MTTKLSEITQFLTRKLISCKNSPSVWELFEELIGDRHIRSDNQLNVPDLNKSFVCHSSDVMLPISIFLNNVCVPSSTGTDVQKYLLSLNPNV